MICIFKRKCSWMELGVELEVGLEEEYGDGARSRDKGGYEVGK